MIKKQIILMCLCMLSVACFAQSIVSDLRLGRHDNAERIVIALNQIPEYHVFTLKFPKRLVVDLKAAQLSSPLPKMMPHSIISQARTGHPKPSDLRLVFTLHKTIDFKAFVLKASAKHSARLVIDITPDTPDTSNTVVDSPIVTIPKRQHLRNVIVVIDPGHGGKDPGASGPRGTHEKNVVLAISRKLMVYINKTPGMRAVLTRRGDYYLPLRRRLAIARRDKGDIFVAIHADAFKNHRSHGASVFALSQRGATSEAARWLAERENYSELSGVKLSNKSYTLRSVLLDLSQTATIGASLDLGSQVLGRIGGMTSLHNRKVEQARFVVLKSPDIPSILIETGFISNPREELNLRNPRYQRRLAYAIFQGIKHYFKSNAPIGTYLAEKHGQNFKT